MCSCRSITSVINVQHTQANNVVWSGSIQFASRRIARVNIAITHHSTRSGDTNERQAAMAEDGDLLERIMPNDRHTYMHKRKNHIVISLGFQSNKKEKFKIRCGLPVTVMIVVSSLVCTG